MRKKEIPNYNLGVNIKIYLCKLKKRDCIFILFPKRSMHDLLLASLCLNIKTYFLEEN